MLMQSPRPPSRRTRSRALADAEAAARAGHAGARLRRQARRRRSSALPEFEALRDSARDIKNHTLAHLDLYLEAFEQQGDASRRRRCTGAETAEDARDIVLEHLPQRRREDRHQGQVDDRRGDRPQRAPRGERHRAGRDRPRRIHHPAAPRAAEPHHRAGRPPHQGAGRADTSARATPTSPAERDLTEPTTLLAEARAMLRERFLEADVGITGANFLIAETGTSVIVTNEGNGDLTQTLPRVHIVLATHREGRCRRWRTPPDPAARAGALGDRPGDLGLHHLLDRAAPAGRSRRAGGIPRRAARQRPLGDARHRVPGHAALHPLRRLHEPLPGLSGGRRPRLWLGLSRADGRGADADADRRRRGRAPAQRLDLLRPLRERLPDAHPAAEA